MAAAEASPAAPPSALPRARALLIVAALAPLAVAHDSGALTTPADIAARFERAGADAE